MQCLKEGALLAEYGVLRGLMATVTAELHGAVILVADATDVVEDAALPTSDKPLGDLNKM